MNKKVLTFSLIIALIMFIGINVKAGDCYTGCTQAADSDAPEGTTCSNNCTSQTNCHITSRYCTNGSSSDCEMSDGTCTCKAVTASASGGGGTYSTNGADGNGFTATASATNCSDYCTYAWTGGNNVVTLGSTSGTSISVNAKAITGSICKKSFTVTVTATNGCGNTGTATVGGTVMVPWPTTGTRKKIYNSIVPQATAEAANQNRYHTACESNQVATYCTVISRGCGTDPPEPEPACYKDGNGFLWWDYNYKNGNSYQYYDSTTGKWKEKTGYTRTDIPEEQCYVKFDCLTHQPDDLDKTTDCNSTSELTGTYYKQCGLVSGSEIGSEIYKIECKETMKTAFNGPVWDDEHSFMYPGTGFGFNYQAKTKVECIGTWHDSFYNAAEKYATDYLKTKWADAMGDHGISSEAASGWFSDASAGIKKIKQSYQNWDLNYFKEGTKEKVNGEIKDDQSAFTSVTSAKKDEYSEKLELVGGDDGSYKTAINTCTSGDQKKPENFIYKVAYTFNLRLPLLYLKDGEYTTDQCTNCGELGRIFPISELEDYADNDNYKYHVNIANLGLNHNWKNSETCSIKMKKKEIVFRSINLTDPFIQKLDANHQIGRNWKNEKYDFTNIIDSEIWSKTSEYNTITIDEGIGKMIKEELKDNFESYLGACSKGRADGSSTICQLYKNAINVVDTGWVQP